MTYAKTPIYKSGNIEIPDRHKLSDRTFMRFGFSNIALLIDPARSLHNIFI